MPLNQIARIILNGNNKIAFSKRNKTSIENPTILNGSRISQTKGNRIKIIRAIGQHAINRNAHNIKAIKVLIEGFARKIAKSLPPL